MTVIAMQCVETRWEVLHVSATLDFLAMERFAQVCCDIKLHYNGISHVLTTLRYTSNSEYRSEWFTFSFYCRAQNVPGLVSF